MRITDIFRDKEQTFSFEFFPPKTEKGLANLLTTIQELKGYRPDFVSVTYGAMGTTRDKTIDITATIQNDYGVTAMAHLTCVGSTADEISSILATLKQRGIRNIMALRGDPPAGNDKFEPTPGGFCNATDLIEFISGRDGFCIGAAGYPEGHVEAESLDQDLEFLRMKMDCGADFIVTQLFLDNAYYYKFRERAAEKGVTLRLIPGIMPVTNFEQIHKFTTMCGCAIPETLSSALAAVRDDADAVRQAGITHAVEQCRDLLKNGAPGIHFYTLNKSPATREIVQQLMDEGAIKSEP